MSLPGPIVFVMAYLQSFYSYAWHKPEEGTLRVAAFARLLNSESLSHREDSHKVSASVSPKDHCDSIYYY